MVEIDRRKAALVAELEVSRGEIRKSLRGCEAELNPASVLRRSVQNNMKVWLPGALVAGVVLSQLVRIRLNRPSPSNVGQEKDLEGKFRRASFGWATGLAKVAFDLARPSLIDWVSELLSGSKFSNVYSQDRNGARHPKANERPNSTPF